VRDAFLAARMTIARPTRVACDISGHVACAAGVQGIAGDVTDDLDQELTELRWPITPRRPPIRTVRGEATRTRETP